jgi:hypothetical protein
MRCDLNRLLLCAALLALLGSGCARVLRLEIPDEFKKKKLKEDPPISCLPLGEGSKA